MKRSALRLRSARAGWGMSVLEVILVLLLSAGAAAAQKKAPSKTSGAAKAKEILANVITAMGGRALTAMKDMTQSITETSFIPQGTLKYEMETVYERPNKLFLKTAMDFGNVTSGYDGKTGWTANRMGVQPMSEAQLTDVRMSVASNLYHLLQNLSGSEYSLSYLGQDRVGDRPVNVVRAFHRPTKTSTTLSVDARSSIVLKKVSQRRGASGLEDFVDEYSDYRDVDGVKVPFKTTSFAGGEEIAELVVRSVKINSGLKAGFFAQPSR
jgi:zinc protease